MPKVLSIDDLQILWNRPEIFFLNSKEMPPFVDVHGHLKRIKVLVDPDGQGRPLNILLNGPQGTGKSLLAAALTLELEKDVGHAVPMITVECHQDKLDIQLTGHTMAVGNEMPFKPGPFPLAIQFANECGVCVMVAEEINSLTPGAQKMFNKMTDWRRGLAIDEIGRIDLRPGCHVIILATMNPIGYGGVYNLNDDLRSRFAQIKVPWPTPVQEKKILKAVAPFADTNLIDQMIALAAESRSQAIEGNISTRDIEQVLTAWYRLKAAGDDTEFALEMAANAFEGTSLTTMLDKIDDTFATQLRKKLEGDA